METRLEWYPWPPLRGKGDPPTHMVLYKETNGRYFTIRIELNAEQAAQVQKIWTHDLRRPPKDVPT